MPGLLSSIFPEFQSTLDYYSSKEAYVPAAKTIGRAVQKAPSGLVDLASLPFTLTGVVKPDEVPGSTAWMDKKGFLIPAEKGQNASEQFGIDTLDALTTLGMPTAAGGAIGTQAAKASPKGGMFAMGGQTGNIGDPIPLIRGQADNDVLLMNKASKLANDEKFAQKVADYGRAQHDTAGKIIGNFAKAVGGKDTSADLGARIQKNFETFYQGIIDTNKKTNDANFAAVDKHPGSSKPIPISSDALARVQGLINDKMHHNSPDGYKAALMDLQSRADKVLSNPDITLKELQQYMKEANQAFTTKLGVPSPYDTVTPGELSTLQTAWKAALKDRLNDAMTKGDPDVADAASRLSQANTVFHTTIEAEKKLQNQTISKFLNLKEDEVLSPEVITQKFTTLTPTQKQFFSGVAQKVDPEMLPIMRRHIFDKIYDGGRIGHSSGQSDFDMNRFLSKVDQMKAKDPELLDFVMGDPKLKAQFESTVENMRQAVNTGPAVNEAENTLARMAGTAAGAATHNVGAYRGAMEAVKWAGTDKDGLYKHLFEGGPPPKGIGENLVAKGIDAAKTGAAATGRAVVGVNPNSGAATGLRQGVNMEVAEGLNNQVMQAAGPSVTAVEGSDDSVDPSDLQWDSKEPQKAPTDSVDPEDLKW